MNVINSTKINNMSKTMGTHKGEKTINHDILIICVIFNIAVIAVIKNNTYFPLPPLSILIEYVLSTFIVIFH